MTLSDSLTKTVKWNIDHAIRWQTNLEIQTSETSSAEEKRVVWEYYTIVTNSSDMGQQVWEYYSFGTNLFDRETSFLENYSVAKDSLD